MQKSDLPIWASVAEIISAIAVVFSLLYVGYEINRNTEILDSDQNLAIFDAMRSWETTVIVDDELADLYVRGPAEYEKFSKAEQLQYRYFVTQWVGIWEQAHDGYHGGLLNTETWTSWNSSFLPDISQAVVVWPEISFYFSDEFQNHMASEIEASFQKQ